MRFGLTGCAAFAVDFGTLVLLRSSVGLPLAVATTTAVVVGGLVHYSLTRLWVFPQESRTGELGRLTRYLVLVAVNVAANLVIVMGLTSVGLDYRAAKGIAVVALFFCNYLLTPRLVMRPVRRSSSTDARPNAAAP